MALWLENMVLTSSRTGGFKIFLHFYFVYLFIYLWPGIVLLSENKLLDFQIKSILALWISENVRIFTGWVSVTL